MCKEEVEEASNIVMGISFILTQSVDILFDSRATHFFISIKLVEMLGLVPTRKSSLLSVILSNGKTVTCEELY